MRVRRDAKRSEKRVREELSAALARRRGDIEQRWADRVIAGIGPNGICPTELRRGMSDYLERLAESLGSSGSVTEHGTEIWRHLAQEHALTRVRQGFDIRQLIREFIILRQVIFEIAREEGVLADERQCDWVADLVEAGMAESIRTYVDSRDYAARRAEADHVGFITHEIRNPLTTTLLLTEQIRRRAALPPEDTRAFDMLERNLRRMDKLISTVVTVEQFETGDLSARPVTLALEEVFEPALAAARIAAENKGLELVADYDPRIRIHADPALTGSVLLNILESSVKFTHEGRVEVRVEESEADVLIHVRDTCPGISPRELRSLFEPFRRGQEHSRIPGAGLGLAIARRAVEAQGGTIDAESIPGRGCHFWFTLPKRARAAA